MCPLNHIFDSVQTFNLSLFIVRILIPLLGMNPLTILTANATQSDLEVTQPIHDNAWLVVANNHATQATIKPDLNTIVQKEIIAGVERYRAKGGLGVIVNVSTGEIISAVTVDRANNKCIERGLCITPDRIMQGLNENVAVLRLINYAKAFDDGWLTPSSPVTVNNGVRVGTRELRDISQSTDDMTAIETFIKESNSSAGFIAVRIGPYEQQKFYGLLHQLSPLDAGTVMTATPVYPKPWLADNAKAIGIGHDLLNTPLHAVSAVTSLVNGGIFVPPTFKKNDKKSAFPRVISETTSDSIRFMLSENFARCCARLVGLSANSIGAIASTSEKIIDGHYFPYKKQTSFLAIFPIDKPKYVLMTMFDEPRPIDDAAGDNTAAANAIVVGGNIIKQVGPMLGVKID